MESHVCSRRSEHNYSHVPTVFSPPSAARIMTPGADEPTYRIPFPVLERLGQHLEHMETGTGTFTRIEVFWKMHSLDDLVDLKDSEMPDGFPVIFLIDGYLYDAEQVIYTYLKTLLGRPDSPEHDSSPLAQRVSYPEAGTACDSSTCTAAEQRATIAKACWNELLTDDCDTAERLHLVQTVLDASAGERLSCQFDEEEDKIFEEIDIQSSSVSEDWRAEMLVLAPIAIVEARVRPGKPTVVEP
jgi:hypothetical protein